MSDLISRQDAIDAVVSSAEEWDRMYIQDLNCRIRDAIKQLPSAEPELPERAEAEWIPCSEMLPMNRKYVLVTFEHSYGLMDHGITWYGELEKKWNTSREVIAWMPLPEPYKGEQDEKNTI